MDGAAETYGQILALDADLGGSGAAVAGVAHVGLAAVAYERNDMTAARQHTEEGIDRCRHFVYSQALATGLSTLALVNQAEGDAAAARALADDALQVGPSAEVVDLLNPVPTQRARILLVQGDVAPVARWAAGAGSLRTTRSLTFIRRRTWCSPVSRCRSGVPTTR
ncbi:MAG: hypothetical protein R2716_12565 [Microthrixaceae bacterium]